MNPRTPILVPILLAGFLAACTSYQVHRRQSAAAHAPTQHNPNHQDAMQQPFPTSEFGQRTVEDVLQDFGPYATDQLTPYFKQAKVTYPPSEMTLVALKAEKKLELWARGDRDYRFIRDYDILAASGSAGPKLRQGDRQVPEGIYRIEGLNPNSNYHLSMKLNYPNEFDLVHAADEGRDDPGSDIFIHGKDVSIGCLAMGDAVIDELFVLVAQVGKENVRVVIAPHDPRLRPLESEGEGLPPWTGELYAMIESEILSLTKPAKLSSNGPASQPRVE